MQEAVSLEAFRRSVTPGMAMREGDARAAGIRAIHTAVSGRVRFKVAPLYRAEPLKQVIETRLADRPGIREVIANPLTATVLVLFESGWTVAAIAIEIEQLVGATGSNNTPAPVSHTVHERPRMALVPSRQPRPARTSAKTDPALWHRLDVAAVLAAVHSDARTGLEVAVARERLARDGPNLLPHQAGRSALAILLGQFQSLPVMLLAASAVVSAATGGLADAAAILAVVAINAAIGFVTESQAERTIRSLTSAAPPPVHVRRAGAVQLVPTEEIVVGDVLVLSPGMPVAADARLIETHRLTLDESSLTGESLPVTKQVGRLVADHVPLADRTNMVYRGTQVTGGQALAVVVATGEATEIGRIQALLGEARPPETPMERQIERLGNQVVWIAVAVCGGVFVVGLLRGQGFLPMLRAAISLAVAAVPEGLPTVATTTLALGLRRMQRQKVLIRSLEAVETLGSVQTVCLDKTGTLTRNRMEVVAVQSGLERLAHRDGRFTGGRGNVNPYENAELLTLLHVAVLCNESQVNGAKGEYVLTGTPTENALMNMALAAGVDVVELAQRHPRVHADYRAENRLYMSTVHENGGPRLIAVKGSPVEVLELCGFRLHDGARVPLDEEARREIIAENERMAGAALRVLGIAWGETRNGSLAPEDRLVWLGLVGMTDPVRDGVPTLIHRFHEAGMATVMITGDQSATAHAIGRELRLSGNDHLDILDSAHLEDLPPETLRALAERVHVFARVSPTHKLRIVQALQGAGRVVAMTGDGINDGPALKAADIGIAMGRAGTDIAREVADVVLEDDNLETLVVAVSQGRTIYNNIRKSVHFLLSTNLSEIMVMFGGVTLGFGNPLNPMQLLWINLVTDVFPALALALEPPEPDVLRRPPRDPQEPIVRTADFRRIAFEGGAITAGALAAYGYGVVRYGAGAQAGGIAFQALTFAQLLHAYSCRSDRHSVFSRERLPPNPWLRAAIGGSAALQAATLFVPGLRGLLGTAPLAPLDLLVVGGAAAAPFLVNEATKAVGARS
jgi:Ca2+-transporting ATPase